MARCRLMPAAACQRMRWKNDGGWTTEIAKSVAKGHGADAFRWRISVAEVETDGPFSAFPGVTRDILLLAGEGMELIVDDAAPVQLTAPFERLHFDGGAKTTCRLLGGPTRDFNVMARDSDVAADLSVHTLSEPVIMRIEPGSEYLAYLPAGRATFNVGEGSRLALGPQDSIFIDASDASAVTPIGCAGNGTVLLVRLSPVV